MKTPKLDSTHSSSSSGGSVLNSKYPQDSLTRLFIKKSIDKLDDNTFLAILVTLFVAEEAKEAFLESKVGSKEERQQLKKVKEKASATNKGTWQGFFEFSSEKKT